MQVKSLNPKDLSRRFKQSFQKKAVFSVTKDFGLLDFRVIEYDERQAKINKAPEGLLTLFVEVIRSFL